MVKFRSVGSAGRSRCRARFAVRAKLQVFARLGTGLVPTCDATAASTIAVAGPNMSSPALAFISAETAATVTVSTCHRQFNTVLTNAYPSLK